MAGIDNNTILYLRGDSFTDLSKNKIEIVNNGVALINDGNFGKCFSFKNSSTFMYFVSDLFNFGTEDFTIEFFVKLNDTHSYHPLFMSGVSATREELSKCSIYECRNDYGGALGTSGTKTIDSLGNYANIWIYVAMVRKDNVLKFYLDGKSTGDGKTQTYNLQNTRYSIGKDLWYPNNYFNGAMYNIRISNIARYTEDFTPPTKTYSSIDINVTNQDNNKINFNISKLGQETINKVEVLINGVVSKTYSDIGDLAYNIDDNLCYIGDNDIVIRVTYDDNYVEEEVLIHTYLIDNLPTTSSLKSIMDRYEVFNNDMEFKKNKLKDMLISKNLEISEDENKLSDLIPRVSELGDAPLYLYKYGEFNSSYTKSIFELGGIVTYKPTYFQLDNSGTTGDLTVSRLCIEDIDFTKYSKLKIECEATMKGYSSNNFTLNIHSTKLAETSGAILYHVSNNNYSKGIVTLDISNISGRYHLNFTIYLATLKVYNVWLER